MWRNVQLMPVFGDDHPGGGDRELVTAFQQGDEGAYEAIYRRHIGRVRRSCSRVLTDPNDVEEAAQETFLKAYQALQHFNGRYRLGAWLSRIAVNVCIDHVRSRSRHQHLVGLPSESNLEWADDGPEEVVAGGNPRIDETLKDMQPLHAVALRLRAVDGLSHREMAGRLRMSPDQVKALLHRARRSFRRAWERVEGWALAPVVALRSRFGPRSEVSCAGVAGGPGVVGLTQSLTAMERAVTGAVIAAVALTGMPSEPPDPTTSSPRRRAPLAGPQIAGGRDQRLAMDSGEAIDGATREKSDALDHILALAAKARDTSDPPESDGESSSGGGGGDEEDPPLGGPASQHKKRAVDEGKKVVEKVDETLGDL
jgi:RNA polymerase sigma-70 factor (ECF subfamily)